MKNLEQILFFFNFEKKYFCSKEKLFLTFTLLFFSIPTKNLKLYF